MRKILKRETIGKCGHIFEFEKLPDGRVTMYLGSKYMGYFKNKNKARRYAKAFEKHVC